jgi:hypothetical protein
VSRLRFHIFISLDGYIAGPNQSEENPIGEGGITLGGGADVARQYRVVK